MTAVRLAVVAMGDMRWRGYISGEANGAHSAIMGVFFGGLAVIRIFSAHLLVFPPLREFP